MNGIDLRVDNADRHRALMRRCARGEITYDQAVESIILGRDL